jgi:dienelactone hydrolase
MAPTNEHKEGTNDGGGGDPLHSKEDAEEALGTLYDLAKIYGRSSSANKPKFTNAHDIKGATPFLVTSNLPSKTQFRIRPIYVEGLNHLGKATRFFAWLSLPVVKDVNAGEEDGSNTKSWPGVVLVHGGGGTAYREWCERWAKDAEFASIAIAVEGQSDVELDEKHPVTNMSFERLQEHFPQQIDDDDDGDHLHGAPGPFRQRRAYGDTDMPLKEQWMFHATANALLAGQLLRRFPTVNGGQVGILGVSWGGVIASTAIGFDTLQKGESTTLFAFAIMAYGIGSMSDSLSHLGRQLKMNPTRHKNHKHTAKYIYDTIWDPVLRLEAVECPTMWISWPGELHFPLPDQADNYNVVGSKSQSALEGSPPSVMTLIAPGLKHGHRPIFKLTEQYLFADSAMCIGPYQRCREFSTLDSMWAQQVNVQSDAKIELMVLEAKKQDVDSFKFSVDFELVRTKQIKKAILVATTDSIDIISSVRKWESIPISEIANVKDADKNGPRSLWKFSVDVSTSATAWYIHVNTKDDDLAFSSRFYQISPLAAIA